MNNDDYETKRKRNEHISRYFLENKIKAHLTKENGTFHNGFIKEVGSDFIILDDIKDGATLVFFRELQNPIEEFQEVVK